MMDLLLATSGGKSQSASGGYVDDVFSAYTYTGNGSTQTINNGIDLAGKGGLVWIKDRGNVRNNFIFDTARGATNYVQSDTTVAQATAGTTLTGFNSTGFLLGNQPAVNASAAPYVSWTFLKAPKFFDVVTYTGDGGTQNIAHSLGVAPGMVIVKNLSTGGTSWSVWHRGLTNGHYILLDQTAAQSSGNAQNQYGNGTATVNPSVASFTVGPSSWVNGNGAQHVAYLFAHDPSADGVIQCGSFTTDGSYLDIPLGWEIQYLLVKRVDAAGDWRILDTARGLTVSPNGDVRLSANTSAAEVTGVDHYNPTATGFASDGGGPGTFIYLAIRRPNKPPTTGTQVYNVIARTGTGAAATVTGVGFAPDLVGIQRTSGNPYFFFDRMRGALYGLRTPATTQDVLLDDSVTVFGQDGIGVGNSNDTNFATLPYINHFFRRAPGFFDVVCYTGTGSATTVAHNLGAVPELMIVKSRSGDAQPWAVFHTDIGATKYLLLNSTAFPSASSAIWNDTAPSSTTFAVGGGLVVNLPVGRNYVAYLFASLPGISKVGSYTGNGTSQTINCGFSTGSRFILIKRTDETGDWYVWDTVRGIVAANDPHLSLNTSAAEVTTDDSVDPEASGFIVNQNTATNINVSGGQYIFLAIA